MGNFALDGNAVLSRGPRRLRLAAILTVAMLAAAAFVMIQPAASAEAASPCGPTINAIVCENQKPGTDPSEWDISGAGDPSIQGFATDISVNAGQRIDFKVDTDARAYSIRIYRTGWYQGLGARYITTVNPSVSLPQNQPECISDVRTELYDCGTWGVSAFWNVPSDAVSGVYIARLIRNDTGGDSHMIFVVRNDGNTSDVVFQTSDPTWHAYNSYGGSDFYQGAANGRAYKISYNRPFATRAGVTSRDFYFSSEFATVRFLERNGYDMSYIAGVDTDRRGGELLNHKVFLSVGHDEYWSGAQRSNIEAARDAGVNLQFLSGNEGYWRTRYERSSDSSQTPYRTLVSYKETWGNSANQGGGKIDTSSPEWTGTSRDPRFADASQGGHNPENALTGTMYMVNHNDLAVTVDSEQGKTRLWRNTNLTGLSSGSSAALAPHTVGYESNEDVDNGFRPAGLIRLSTTNGPTPQYLTDYGNTVVSGTTEHHVTLYKAPSGALVFSAASIQWGWGLDAEHDGAGAPADARMQQAQVNLLADMGAQPGSLMSGLVAATKSTDTTAPTTAITSPTNGQAIPHGTVVNVTGTASDVGGRVAGVEVSTDGGASWRLATGTTSWSFSYVQQGSGTATVKARAIDDSANYNAAGASVSVTVGGPYSVFGGTVPALPAVDDRSAAELGLRFTAEVDGYVSGVRFYKGSGNSGQHVGTLWSAQGARLGTVTFGGETASGWQTALFTTPIAVVAGQQYTVSYTAPNGGYAYEEWYWPYKARATAPLSVPTTTGVTAAGVYGNSGAYPTETYRDANYFVDVVFEAAQDSPVRLTSQAPAPGVTGVARDTVISTLFTRPVQPASVSMTVTAAGGGAVAGTTTYDAATRRARFAPAAPLQPVTQYTVTVAATPVDATTFEPGGAWTFTTANDASSNTCPCTLYTSSDTPPIASVADSRVTVGTKFSVTEAGFISGINFYKGPGNTGTHVGTLWAGADQQLAQATFVNESATGWQTAWFTSPVAVNPGVEYTVSYVATAGGYSAAPGAFGSGLTREPLVVPASGGAYTYADGFPSQSSTTSYYVDPIFVRSAAGPQLVSTTPAAGAEGVARTTKISATFSEALSATPTVAVTASGSPVAGAVALSADGKTATFTPSSSLPFDSVVSVTMSQIESASGSGHDRAWTFRTAVNALPSDVTFFGSGAPAAGSASDGTSVELGMKFQSSVDGRITAIRFYKVAGDTGAHTGTLWSATGQQLATVAFQNESAEGWQRAQLSVPAIVEAGKTYTVSYLSPQGKYAHASSYFTAPVTSGPLTAVAQGNGTFRYGSGGVMPESSWASSNYFVDVEFSAGTTPDPVLTVTAKSPEGVDVAFDTTVTATLSAAAPSPVISLARDGSPVPGASTYDAAARMVTFTPTNDLVELTTYTATLRVDGQVLETWSFKTAPPQLEGVVGTVFGDALPDTAATTDSSSVELGTAFSVAYAAQVTAIRFYKGEGNTGTHIGHLWNAAGDELASVTFENETATGWQRAVLASPVTLVPGETYVASYLAPNGRYAVTSAYFANPVTNGYVTAPAGNNGRFTYTATGAFPSSSWNSSAYFVDAEVTYTGETPVVPVTLTARVPAVDATGVDPGVTVSATLTGAVSAAIEVTSGGAPVAGASTFDAATGVARFTPAAPLARGASFTATVRANDAAVTGGSWSFATAPLPAITARTPGVDATGVSPASAVSATLANASSASITVSAGGSPVGGSSSFDASTGVVAFTPSAALARGTTYQVTVTADGSSVTGGTWSFQTTPNPALTARTPAPSATNVNPVSPGIGATLTNASSASISVTTGGTAVTGASAFDASTGVVTFTPNPQLEWGRTYVVTVTADGTAVSGGTWSFSTLPLATLTARTPASGATNVNPATAKVSATLSGAVTASIGVKLGTADVAGTSSLDSATGVVTFTPTVPLDWSKTYTATVTANGTSVASGSWSFTTMAKQDQVSLFTTGTPANANANAFLAYQVGTRFRTSAPGVVTTIRYYKGNQNNGTHIGYLRAANGSILSQVTFRNETSSGWQTAVLATPVRLTVNTEYRVTLYSSSGRYAVTNNALASVVTVAPLSTIANGGVAGFGTSNPSSTNSNKYWVDVVFDPDN